MAVTKHILEQELPEGIGIRLSSLTREWVAYRKGTNAKVVSRKTDVVNRWKNPGRVMAYVVREALRKKGEG